MNKEGDVWYRDRWISKGKHVKLLQTVKIVGGDLKKIADQLVGAEIHEIGVPEDQTLVEGGGIVIDFFPEGGQKVKRLVIGHTELGCWVEYIGDK